MTRRNLRSSSMQGTNDDLSELNEILAPLKQTITETSIALENITKLYEAKFLKQQRHIEILQTRLQRLEEKIYYQEQVNELHDRKLDDLEQVSRKVNLRLKGIEIFPGDSPVTIMNQIKLEISDLGLEISDGELDRCHRIGKPYMSNHRRQHDVLVKFRTWRSRNTMYQNRKKFSFRVFADLTFRRDNVLQFAKEECKTDENGHPMNMAVNRVVDFVFSDLNCKIKFKSKENRFYGISSEHEFLRLVDRLDEKLTASVDFATDENNRGNYHKFEEETTKKEIFY
jgi:hypothetical protein